MQLGGEKPSIFGLLKIRRVAFAAASAVVNLNHYTFIDPVLAIHMNATFGTSANAVGMYFFVLGFGFMAACLAFAWLAKALPRRLIMHAGALIQGGGLLMTGPSKMFGMPESTALVCIGLAVSGLGCGFFLVALV